MSASATATPTKERSRTTKAYDHQLAARLWPYIRPHWKLLALALLALPLSAGLQLLPPYMVKLIIDNAITPGAVERIAPYAAMLIAVLVGQYLASAAHTVLIQVCGQRAMHNLRCTTHQHLLSLRVSFFDRTPVGTVMTRVTNDVESIAEAFASGLVAFIADVVKLLGIVCMMLWLDWRLAALTFCILPVLTVIAISFQKLLRKAYRKIRRRLALINATLQEQISGVKIVQIFGRELHAQREFETVNRDYRDAYRESIRWDATLFALVEMLGSLTIAALLWYGGVKVVGGAVTFGLLIAFIEYVQRFFEPIRDLSAKYAVMQQAMAASERVFGLLDTDEPDAPRSSSGADNARPTDASVRFDEVQFSYDGETPLFNQLSFDVKAGDTVAIVGPTGSGKSTIVRLLTRLYEIEHGAIRLGGCDIRDLTAEELRRRIVVLSQDVFVFAGTIAENITLGDPAITQDAVQRAAERVGLTRLFDLDHQIGERGSNLSQGERQLVVFARALAREPDVLVLDEATASVDPESEALIQAGIETLLAERTAIVIAHRLSTIERADNVIVIHRGAIAEQGSHQQLLEQQGIYARLHKLQYVNQE